MSLGLRFQQKLRGTYHRIADPGAELPASLDVEVELPLWALVRAEEGRLHGHLRADGYADAPIRGRYRVDLLARKIVYEFHFAAPDGRSRRFHGETVFDITRPVRAIEDLVGRIYDADREDARVILSVPFDAGLRRMLRSLRANLTRGIQ
ncbi:MAG: hypothetical protein AAGE52_24010 [Myxococcota bacterium]